MGIWSSTRTVKAFFVAGTMTSASSLYSRAKTRRTLPSTAGTGDAKRNAGHRARRVVTDARQTAQGVVVGGQVAAVLLADDAGSLLHIVDAVVVAQPLHSLRRASGSQAASAAGSGKAAIKRS